MLTGPKNFKQNLNYNNDERNPRKVYIKDPASRQGKNFKAVYHKNPVISDTRKFIVITIKVEQDGISLE